MKLIPSESSLNYKLEMENMLFIATVTFSF